jgi:hypothetical protein
MDLIVLTRTTRYTDCKMCCMSYTGCRSDCGHNYSDVATRYGAVMTQVCTDERVDNMHSIRYDAIRGIHE